MSAYEKGYLDKVVVVYNKFKNVVKRANRINPNAFIIAIGCYAQLKPNELASVLGVNLVLGANEKFNILNYF